MARKKIDPDLLMTLFDKTREELLHLPYTAKFDRLYDAYTKETGETPGKHEVWEVLVEAEGWAAAPEPLLEEEERVSPSTPAIHLLHPRVTSRRTDRLHRVEQVRRLYGNWESDPGYDRPARRLSRGGDAALSDRFRVR